MVNKGVVAAWSMAADFPVPGIANNHGIYIGKLKMRRRMNSNIVFGQNKCGSCEKCGRKIPDTTTKGNRFVVNELLNVLVKEVGILERDPSNVSL